MVMEFLHQADLSLLLNRLVGRTVFADTESVVRPDEFHRQLHKCRHTYRGFHIIAEDEERTACRDDSAMQRHTDHHTSHRQLAYTCLQELTAEIAFLEGVGLLEETVGLVGVREVSRRNDHVAYVLCQMAEDSR